MITQKDISFLQQAVDLATEGVINNKGGPFGCVIVKNEKVIGSGSNLVTSCNDPTAHAEIVAIRNACEQLGTYQLTGCTLYASCEPCPMCLGAIYWARPTRVIYACTRFTAAAAGFDDAFIYEEIALSIAERKISFELYHDEKFLKPFHSWEQKEKKGLY
ncbi:nucleoside deaminase [Olivibacter domesticus]|uniref:tRNA(Arg) A34 adenosine deaminase TadA n=1 Tax=Olivibacter domesticus TaxID=407022 RepID=A0A1H7GAG8_OLID1|nr:nucleoside deaminase [Olivibacter domesticus]SEK35111.1 tRNA(Arg) A34 adenosine deaminase TadA [Olivibacter domesticus]